jgi:hypothetical protein
MNTQEFIDQRLRLALGNMHVELILAQARIADLEEQVAKLEETTAQADGAIPDAPKKVNGKDHTRA